MISLDTAFDAGRGGDDKDWDASGIWEVSFIEINIKDEDSKGFYEDLPNLRDFVPASFFSKFPTQESSESDPTPEIKESKEQEKVEEEKTKEDAEDKDADESTPSSSNMENLLLRLSENLERATIDQIAVFYIYF
jgi:hypothetical protein